MLAPPCWLQLGKFLTAVVMGWWVSIRFSFPLHKAAALSDLRGLWLKVEAFSLSTRVALKRDRASAPNRLLNLSFSFFPSPSAKQLS